MANDERPPMEQAKNKRLFWKTVLAVVATPVVIALAVVTRGKVRPR